MKAYIAFTKKEFTECSRTYKLFLMITFFLILGMLNPITAKITPMLLDSFIPEGIFITITEPTALDSWAQFFKNVPQMGLIILVIIFSGIMANEFSRGTLINMLTKGLSRKIVILSKFTMASVIWTLSYSVCSFTTYFYTAYLWNTEGIVCLIPAIFCVWLFGILLLSVIILGGVLFKGYSGGLLFTGCFTVVLFLMNIFPNIQKYNPVMLVSGNMAFITGVIESSEFVLPVIISAAGTAIFITLSVILFNKKQI